MSEPIPNRKKVYLAEVAPPLSDQDDFLSLELGPSDYWTSEAMAASIEQIYADVKDGKLDPFNLPRQLDCHLVVITADDKLVLGKRTGNVKAAKHQWGASLGESIDGDMDLDPDDGLINPVMTIRRALGRKEELGLDQEAVQSAEIRILGLTTEWETICVDLIALVRLKKTGALEVRDAHQLWAKDGIGEISALDFVDFNLDPCLPLMLAGLHTPQGSPALRNKIFGVSRVAILAALVHQFQLDKVRSRLEGHRVMPPRARKRL